MDPNINSQVSLIDTLLQLQLNVSFRSDMFLPINPSWLLEKRRKKMPRHWYNDPVAFTLCFSLFFTLFSVFPSSIFSCNSHSTNLKGLTRWMIWLLMSNKGFFSVIVCFVFLCFFICKDALHVWGFHVIFIWCWNLLYIYKIPSALINRVSHGFTCTTPVFKQSDISADPLPRLSIIHS